MSSPPLGSNRRAWWAASGGGEGRLPPERLDVNHPAAPSLTTPVSATTPSTSTSAAWASAVHHSQQRQYPEHTPQRHRPPYTPISPPAMLKDPRRAPTREFELAPPRDYAAARSPREYEAGPQPREYERGRPPPREYEGERLPGVREVGRLPHEYEGGRPKRDYEAPRPPRGYEEREIHLPPLEYGLGRGGAAPRPREEREEGTNKATKRAGIERKPDGHERDELDDDDERSNSQRAATGTSASPSPRAFNGWDSATLYYHAIHRLPPLSSWCCTVLEMALKSGETWVVSRHANDLPSYARIMAFYGGERVEAVSSRATSEKGSTKGSVDLRVGSASFSASEGTTRDSEDVLAAEIVTVGTFVRRLEVVVEALQAQMAPYDLTMPRTDLLSNWREIGDRIATKSNAELRSEGSAKHMVTDEPETMHAGTNPRPRKRRREREEGPVTGVLPLLIGRDWIVVAADSATGSVLIYDAGHALDAAHADMIADEVMRAVVEASGLKPLRVAVRHLRPPDRVLQRHTVLMACAALEMLGSAPAPTADRSLPVYLGLWSKLLAQGITLAIPPSFDRPAAAQSALYTKNVSASRVLRDRIVWTIHTGTLACPFRGYW